MFGGIRRLQGLIPRLRPTTTTKTTTTIRSLSSTTGAKPSNPNSRLVYAIAITAALSGSLGFALSRSSDTPIASQTASAGKKITYGSPQDLQNAIKDLRVAFGDEADDKLSVEAEILEAHGFSHHTYHPSEPHSIVVFPGSTEDVVKVVNISRAYRIPIIPYSAGTSLEGHTSGVSHTLPFPQMWIDVNSDDVCGGCKLAAGSICVDMSNMDKILDIHGRLHFVQPCLEDH